MILDVEKIRKLFPIYEENPNIVYLDTAASSLKPTPMINTLNHYYQKLGVNIHRGVYKIAHEATDLYENARTKLADFINASYEEIIFTKGTTNSLNMVANHYLDILGPNDEIITSELEHHSSFLPWLNVSQKTQAKLNFIELDNSGKVTVEAFKQVLNQNTKVVVITAVSNVMGNNVPIKEMIRLAHEVGAHVIVDAAQAAPHQKLDVKDLDCDYLAFSGHKMLGPSGIGILYMKSSLAKSFTPIEFGGEMINKVAKDSMTFKESPYKFEAGTPNIAGAIGLAVSIDLLTEIGLDNVTKHVDTLYNYTIEKLKNIEGVRIYNHNSDTGIIAFNIDDIHPHDAASIFDKNNICVRAGHHCAQLILKWLGAESTLRASFYIYNDFSDCDKFVESVIEARDFFRKF
ncbi:MAG: cysteine desulfurase [Acholeplasmataceae bacterium]|nr:cysteine desulfurase [Acholeplasmataceae bacterium]